MKFNKGAMFGLDARIALAIFGALSVISGAALYSAIQEAKVVSLITDLNEVDKASIAYLLDTGENLQYTQSASLKPNGGLAIDSLVVQRNTNAKVPYLPYKDFNTSGTHDYILIYTKPSQELYIYAKENIAWSDVNTATGACKKSSTSCNHYVCTWGASNDFMKSVESKIDNTASPADDDSSGNIRYNKTSGFLCIKGSVYNTSSSPLA